ncbi:MAG: hypothetical protein NWF03_04590 [Candidatus Bathyarchaeota archaeon]|nr:hypothetical protein [Candidatus Bathyarchaeota archaeon]
MNKMLTYTLLAILLGTVTMLAPLALYEKTDAINGGEYSIQFNDTETTSERTGDMVVAPGATNTDTKYTLTFDDTEPTDFSPIAWMTIPSFVVALGVFVYLKKRVN